MSEYENMYPTREREREIERDRERERVRLFIESRIMSLPPAKSEGAECLVNVTEQLLSFGDS
jgi:hypothetical protein